MDCLRSTVGAALIAGLLALAGCNSEPQDPSQDAPPVTPTYLVTTSGTHVAMSPIVGAFPVKSGETIRIAVTADAGYTLASAVGGSCAAGTWNAGSYTSGPTTANCILDFSAALAVFTVTPSADAGVTTTPGTAQTVALGAVQTFALTPAPGYLVSVNGTCPAGTLSSGTYVTGAVTANCTVHFAATLGTVSVTVSGDAHAALSPGTVQTVSYGATSSFTLTTAVGYTASIGGTCAAGSLVGAVYTTGPLTANCSLSVTSTLRTSAVTPVGDAHVTVTPGALQTVNYGATQAFTVTPSSGYTLASTAGGTCPAGAFVANVYTTGAVIANCSVSFTSFLAWSGVRQQGASFVATEGMSVASDSAGNTFITGYTEGNINSTALVGARDAFVAKYDPSGALVWQRNLGATSTYTSGLSVAVDRAGNVVSGGYGEGGLNGNPTPDGEYYFIAKYAADGTLLWVRQAGGLSSTSASNGVATDAAGNIYIAGNTTTGLDGNSQNGTYDGFVAKYDADGTLVWLRQYGTGGVQSFADRVAVDAAGNVFVAGTARGGLAGNT